MLPGCCPSCGFSGEIEAFLIEPEAKRAIARVAALEPAIGKVLGPYLRLFGSGKRGVQLRRAVKLIDELTALVESGSVCRDERAGLRRPATPTMWAAGIEQMLTARASLVLPLESHGYLRAVVFGLADKADAAQERQREEDARVGKHLRSASGTTPSPHQETPLERQLAWIARTLDMGGLTPEEAEEEREKAYAKHGRPGEQSR